MNRRLRSRHRGLFVLLVLTLPAGFVLALAGRNGPAVGAGMPAEAQAPLLEAKFDSKVMWGPNSLLTSLRHSADGALTVRLHSWTEPAAPGLLLYWSADPPREDELPAAARLLGPLGSSAGLPRDLSSANAAPGGWLVLYSLGHAEVLGSLELSAGGDL